MTPAALKSWRTRMGLSQHAAADMLGVSHSWYRQMEAGQRRDTGEAVAIPKTVAYSCAWIALHGAGNPFPDA